MTARAHEQSVPTNLAQLYAISRELLRFEDLEHTFPAVIALLAEAIPIRSAFLGLDHGDRARSVILEDPRDPPGRRKAARDRARDAYAYLTDQKHLLRDEEAVVLPLTAPESKGGDPGSEGTKLVLPLVVARRPVFGVLQIETGARADEATLLLMSTIANQLAIALDRHALVQTQLADAGRRIAVDSALRLAADARRDEAETLSNRYLALIDGLEQAFLWECDARTFALTYVSARAAELLGRERDDLLQTPMSLVELTAPADRATVRDGLERAVARAQRFDHRIVTDDGRPLWLHSNVRLAERARSPARLQGVSFHVTATKEAEEILRIFAELGATLGALDHETAVADLLRFVSRSICDVAVLETLGEDGTVARGEFFARQGIVGRAEGLLGITTDAERAHVITSREPLLFRVDDGGSEPPDSVRRTHLRGVGVRWFAVLPLIARDRPMGTLSLYILDDTQRAVPGDTDMLREIARRASIAIDNARLYEDAERASRARDDMLAFVSHDLRNPLGAIMLHTDVLLAQNQPALPALQQIRRASAKMTRLIEDLLDIANIEAGRFAVDRRRVAVTALLSNVVADLGGRAAAKGVALECEVASELPEVSADPGRVDQVIGNLVGNAIKFTPAGGLVRVTAEPAERGVRFTVRDTGAGIAADDLPHVFDRFFQGRDAARLGTGLGLFISRGIVEAHGETITVESAPGVGSAFSFVLPRAQSSEPAYTEGEQRSEPRPSFS